MFFDVRREGSGERTEKGERGENKEEGRGQGVRFWIMMDVRRFLRAGERKKTGKDGKVYEFWRQLICKRNKRTVFNQRGSSPAVEGEQRVTAGGNGASVGDCSMG